MDWYNFLQATNAYQPKFLALVPQSLGFHSPKVRFASAVMLGVCVWWGVALEHEPFVDGVAGGLCEDFAGCLMPRVPVRTVSGGLENGG